MEGLVVQFYTSQITFWIGQYMGNTYYLLPIRKDAKLPATQHWPKWLNRAWTLWEGFSCEPEGPSGATSLKSMPCTGVPSRGRGWPRNRQYLIHPPHLNGLFSLTWRPQHAIRFRRSRFRDAADNGYWNFRAAPRFVRCHQGPHLCCFSYSCFLFFFCTTHFQRRHSVEIYIRFFAYCMSFCIL